MNCDTRFCFCCKTTPGPPLCVIFLTLVVWLCFHVNSTISTDHAFLIHCVPYNYISSTLCSKFSPLCYSQCSWILPNMVIILTRYDITMLCNVNILSEYFATDRYKINFNGHYSRRDVERPVGSTNQLYYMYLHPHLSDRYGPCQDRGSL